MTIPSGGCDAMHAAVSYEALRKERDRLSEALGRANADAAHMEHARDMAQAERDAMAKRLVAAETEIGELKAKLAKVTAERDAAVADMGRMLDNCKACVHEHDAPEDCGCECLTCKKNALARTALAVANSNGGA